MKERLYVLHHKQKLLNKESIVFPKNPPRDFKKYYYEYRAAINLQLIFPERYSIYVKSERPDFIYADSYGVEVTRALDQEQELQRDFFSKKLAGKRESEIPENSLTRFQKSGLDLVLSRGYNNTPVDKIWGYAGDGGPFPALLTKAINHKLHEINSINFAPGYSLSLYVFSSVLDEYESVDDLQFLINNNYQKEEYERNFNSIFVDTGCNLFEYDSISKTITQHRTEQYMATIKEQAIDLALKATE